MLVWVSKNNDPLCSFLLQRRGTYFSIGWFPFQKTTWGVHGSDGNYRGFQSIYIHPLLAGHPFVPLPITGAAFDKFRSAFAALNYCSMAGFSIVCSDGTTAASAWEVPGISGMVEGRV